MTNYPPSMNQNEGQASPEAEISLLDIVNFLQESWKKLAIASVVGAVLGLGGWFVLGKYTAEYVLLNNNSCALDLVSWKMLQKSLPNLADQIIDENKVPEGQASLYKELSSDQWWQKNVVPSYALSKADTKDLSGISKDLDGASTTILNLTINASGASKSLAIDNARAVSQFLRSGSAYLQLRSLLNSYQSQTLSTVAELQQKITITQVEMGYQLERIRQLEDLHKRFLGSNAPTQQVVDAHRFWEAQYLDCIPVLLKQDWTQACSSLPVLLLEHWSDLKSINLTDKYLEISTTLYDRSSLVMDTYHRQLRALGC